MIKVGKRDTQENMHKLKMKIYNESTVGELIERSNLILPRNKLLYLIILVFQYEEGDTPTDSKQVFGNLMK